MTVTVLPIPWWATMATAGLLITLGWACAYWHLTSMRNDIADQRDDLDRLLAWTPPEEPREPGHTPWPKPLSPRDHEVELPRRDRERMLAFAHRGALPPVGQPPAINVTAYRDGPTPMWEPVDTGAIRRWTLATGRPPLRSRIRARIAAMVRPYWTDVHLWLAMHEPQFWTEHDLPERSPSGGGGGRHRAADVSTEPAPLARAVAATKTDLGMPTGGEFERRVTAMLDAELLSTVVRGAR